MRKGLSARFALCFGLKLFWRCNEKPGGLQTAYQNPQKQRNSRFSSQKLRHKRPTLSPGVE